MGINHSLGSYPEAFRNTYLPRGNLKVSNQFFGRSSMWHRLGVRGFWDGEHFEKYSFDPTEQYTDRSIDFDRSLTGVAFRCMKIE